jgi:hypothetical protein
MTVPLVRINPLEYPSNALLNFAPLNNALMQNRRAQEFDATLEEQRLQHDQANQLAQSRLGLDRDRMGLETERLGIERGRFGLAQQAEARTEEDRRNTALANLGSTISSITDPTARRSAWERLVMSNPAIPTPCCSAMASAIPQTTSTVRASCRHRRRTLWPGARCRPIPICTGHRQTEPASSTPHLGISRPIWCLTRTTLGGWLPGRW